MAFRHGRVTVIDIGSTDYSGFIDNANLSLSNALAKVTAKGDVGDAYIGGIYSGTLTVSGHYDDGTSGTPGEDFPALLLAGTETTILFQPEGTVSSGHQRSASFILQDYDEDSPGDNKISWNSTWMMSGAISLADQSA